jgi:hypothetical protein
VIVPQLVRSTPVEEPPAAPGVPSRSGVPEAPVTLVSGEPVGISVAD